MAKTEKRARERIVSSSYFLGCFGLSRKIYSDKAKVAAEVGCEMKKKKKRSRWLLCSKFRSKNREIKPAPIEETEITTSSVEDETDKRNPVSLISHITTDRTNVLADDKAVNQETKETKPKELRDITTDRSKPTETLASSREDTRPERISNTKPSRETTGSRVRKFDPVIGISVIILTLVIMLVWGRVFAILCTSAWCYSLPRLRNVAALVKRSASDGSARLNSLVV